MAGRGAPPKDPSERRNPRAKPATDWHSASGVGWQHGRRPALPQGLTPGAIRAWRTWFGAWFAGHWGPEDLPGLTLLIRIFDLVERGEYTRASELRIMMDTYGITPKGQQDRRWKPPEASSLPVRGQSGASIRERLSLVDDG